MTMGRPKKEIDQRLFQSLCAIQCTEKEICAILDVTDKTLTRWCRDTYGETFSDAYKRLSVDGKMSLRRAMFERAVKNGNVTMQIWLSKQYLGMTDKVKVDQSEVLNKLDSVLSSVKEDADAAE